MLVCEYYVMVVNVEHLLKRELSLFW